MPQVFKIGSMRIIEARSEEVIQKWISFFGTEIY